MSEDADLNDVTNVTDDPKFKILVRRGIKGLLKPFTWCKMNLFEEQFYKILVLDKWNPRHQFQGADTIAAQQILKWKQSYGWHKIKLRFSINRYSFYWFSGSSLLASNKVSCYNNLMVDCIKIDCRRHEQKSGICSPNINKRYYRTLAKRTKKCVICWNKYISIQELNRFIPCDEGILSIWSIYKFCSGVQRDQLNHKQLACRSIVHACVFFNFKDIVNFELINIS